MIDALAQALGYGATDPAFWMPLVLMGLLYLVIIAAAVLDGFDIGVGCLVLFAPLQLRGRMLELLSPWRDANEFWLFLGLGLFVAAFPGAVGAIMGQLYLPLALLSLGVLLRSISFEMRLRAPRPRQSRWMGGFAAGSLCTALAHGMLLGQIVMPLEDAPDFIWFMVFMGICVFAAYCMLGAGWLIMREGGALRARAVFWGRRAIRWMAAGAVGLTIMLAFANTGVFLKWSDGQHPLAVPILWASLLICFVSTEMCLQRMINSSFRNTALPFSMTLAIFLIVLGGLGYSFFPFLVLDNITIWDAAASVPSLTLVLYCAVIALLAALVFNIRVYWRMFGLSKRPEPPAYPGHAVKQGAGEPKS
ncbi:cytochrome d ubiquinol oxidase subunit II [Allopusillimonas soli]|uniref:Cytochrome d ubiquinol oxidase subunit II n=1 Tax=Allopusillimonas soli TaxID=659016 RepID=A0A853F765_9BURK|nr:cytochrome d ubiquinol oxidase subunit II [Allopusillimonas soli]NYT35658.1 cytochrome d ubiquinol oxidase subunit II [Allopusillimonas soli]TEA76051.1 cytochrome d ubiquinol oxidase subunit II [Allopusillimonas soli]